jgi:hypothetical protein
MSYLKSITQFSTVTVPLQLQVTAILNVTKPLLVTLKVASYVTE